MQCRLLLGRRRALQHQAKVIKRSPGHPKARSYLRGLVEFDVTPEALQELFGRLPEYDFCLQRDPSRLRLVAVPACGWTDLGTPARLASWLDRHREAPFWQEHSLPRLPGADGLTGTLQVGGG